MLVIRRFNDFAIAKYYFDRVDGPIKEAILERAALTRRSRVSSSCGYALILR